MTNLMITDTFQMNADERSALTDEQILSLAYGIKYYSVNNPDATVEENRYAFQHDLPILQELKTRLAEIRTGKQSAKPAPSMTRCDCGHTVESINVMNASRGTACPDCYDRMSD